MQNKKILALFILIFSVGFTSQLFSQKINKLYVVKNSAKFSPGDIVSPDIRDVNGDVAAALIIETDLEGLSFEANNGIVKLIHNQPGEYKLLLQPSERVVYIYAKNYQPLRIILYNYDIMLKSGQAWRIKITGDKQLDKLPIVINRTPNDASVYIDGKKFGNGNTFQVSIGKHKIRIEKEGYKAIEKDVDVNTKNILFNYTLQSIDPVAVNINSTPQGATVFVNEDEKGKTPLAKFLYPGKYKVRLSLAGYLSINEEIAVTENGSNEFNYILTKDISYLTLDVTPTDVEVRINDRITKTGNLELLPGNYIIRISKSKYIPIIDTVNLKLGEKIHKKYSLAKNVGYLTLNVTPADAEILINKEDYSGRTEIELAPGTYKIEVKKEGYYGKEEVLNVELGKTIKKQYTLEPKVGTLQFSISPPNANVKLIRNGEVINNWKGLKIVKNLLVGKYEIEAKANGYKTYKKGITIEENKRTVIDAKMEEGSDLVKTKIIQLKNVRIELVGVQGGTFEMGSNNGYSDEKPIHRVKVDDFYIGKFEVTFEEYDRFCEVTGRRKPSDEGWGRGRRPVINISWYDAVAYCNWLSAQEGLQKFYNINGTDVKMNWEANGYRLPTEAEWEYACKGGMHSASYKYSGSNNINSVAWYGGNSGDNTHPVGTKQPNELGIYDMSGNVWEWCNDWYGENYYSNSPQNSQNPVDNPKGPSSGSNRVRRGGSWSLNASYCRSAYRSSGNPAYTSSYIGFRISRTP